MGDLFQGLQGMLGGLGGAAGNQGMDMGSLLGGLLGGAGGMGGVSGIAGIGGQNLLGGLVGALMGSGRRSSSSALLLQGGAALAALAWGKYKDMMKDAGSKPGASLASGIARTSSGASGDGRAERAIRALVFAAKADGHIDDEERRNIDAALRKISAGPEAERLVREAIEQPLDPALVARGVSSHDEALQLYVLSRSVIDVDQFMEINYLDALARALDIPDNVRAGIESDLAAKRV
jgi:uncharacterized membrane protein YebE (DUF533 family)